MTRNDTDPRAARGQFFIAAMPPAGVAMAVQDAFKPHRDWLSGIRDMPQDAWRWINPVDYHVTLVLLGHVAHADLDYVQRALEHVTTPPFAAQPRHSGYYSKPYSRLRATASVPARTKRRHDALFALFEENANNGFLDVRRQTMRCLDAFRFNTLQMEMTPHMTVARSGKSAARHLVDVANRFSTLRNLPSIPVDHVSLMQVVPQWMRQGDSQYHEVGRVSLETRRFEWTGEMLTEHASFAPAPRRAAYAPQVPSPVS